MVLVKGVVLTLLLVSACAGSRILVVFPVPIRSYSLLGDSIVRTLTDAGHKVTYVTVFPKKPANADANVTYTYMSRIDISSVLEDEPGWGLVEMQALPLRPAPAPSMLGAGTAHARRALHHRAVRGLLADPQAAFDAVLAHWFHTGLLAPLGSVFECPLVWYVAGEVCWGAARLLHEPASAVLSAGPHAAAGALPPYTLPQRAAQLWHQLYAAAWAWYYMEYVEHPLYVSLYAEPLRLRARRPAAYEALVAGGALILANAHPPLAQALPLPHSTRMIGGHHLDLPVQPLPKNLQTYLDNVKNGAILVDLGVDVRSAEMPARVVGQLLEMFAQLEQAVLWRLDARPPHVPANVRVLQRAPTLAILCHSNTMMLVSDGSAASLGAALQCGVPAVAVPLHGDQFLGAELEAARGFGLRVYFTSHLAWTLREAIGEILGNYREIVLLIMVQLPQQRHRGFETLKLRPAPASAELAAWVSWAAAAAPGARHLRSAAPLLPVLQRHHLDLWLLAAMLLWFLSKVVKVIRAHMKNDDCDKKNN